MSRLRIPIFDEFVGDDHGTPVSRAEIRGRVLSAALRRLS